jgi:hypothetical protein
MAIYYLDFESGNDSNDGTSFANRKKSWLSGQLPVSGGDTLRIMASPYPVALGSGTWAHKSNQVLLSGMLVSGIYKDGVWTGAANVTCSVSTTARENANSASIAIGAAFGTGRSAGVRITGGVNISGYDRIGLWIQANAVQNSGSGWLGLCTDTGGATWVEKVIIPRLPVANAWNRLVLPKSGGGEFTSTAIFSLSLNHDRDPGAVTYLIDNVMACRSTGLHLNSLIGTDPNMLAPWYGIVNITGTGNITYLTLDRDGQTSTSTRGYHGASGSYLTYKMDPILITGATATSTDLFLINKAALAETGRITYSFGWDRTGMSSRADSDMTWVLTSPVGFYGYGPNFNTKSYATVENFGNVFFNYHALCQGTCSGIIFKKIGIVGPATRGISFAATTVSNSIMSGIISTCGANPHYENVGVRNKFYNLTGYSCDGAICLSIGGAGNYYSGLYVTNAQTYGAITDTTCIRNVVHDLFVSGCVSHGLYFNNNTNNIMTKITSIKHDGASAGIIVTGPQGNNYIYDYYSSGNSASISVNNAKIGNLHFMNWRPMETTEITALAADTAPYIVSINHDGIPDNHFIFTDGGQINTQTGNRRTASGVAWQMQPTNTTTVNEIRPLAMTVGAVAVNSGSPVTGTIWVNLANTGMSGQFKVMANQLSGINDTVIANTVSGTTGAWQQLNVAFTPLQKGVVEFEIACWGGSATGTMYVDDFSVVQ